MKRRLLNLLASMIAVLSVPAMAGGLRPPVKVTMSVDEAPIVPLLARSLGFLEQEGVEIVPVRIEDHAPNDFEMQRPMRDGRIDVAYHWYNHAVFGARHGLPVTAVMVFNDAPGMSVLVARAKRAEIRGPADFGRRAVAAGAGYGTKALVTHALAARHGASATDYRLVATASAGRQEKIVGGLSDGSVDLVTSEEPVTSVLKGTGLVDPLLDLTTRAGTQSVLGAPWPAQSLLMSPTFLRRRPTVAQRVVNAFVRTMRWIETHSAEDIARQLPPGYFETRDPARQAAQIRAILPGFARRDYSVPPTGAALVSNAIAAYDFDTSASGTWRATSTVSRVDPRSTYDNRLVRRAMARIP